MNITLPPELEKMVEEKVKSGCYDSPSQVIRDGLQLLKEQDQLKQLRREELRREVQKGIDDMREGRYTTYNSAEELIADVIGEARAEFETKRKNGK